MTTLLRPMILIPYIFSKSRNGEWYKISIFLCDGGRSLWSEDTLTRNEIIVMLNENGFPFLDITIKDGIYFIEVDSSKIDMSTFYSWEELDPTTAIDHDLWRTFDVPKSLWGCSIFREHYCGVLMSSNTSVLDISILDTVIEMGLRRHL